MEESNVKQAVLEVRDPAMALLLVHPKAVVALAPFLGQERTLSEAAAEAGLKLPTMSAWVGRLLGGGVLEQTGERKRAGSPIRSYRSVSNAFDVPYALLPAAVVERFLRQNGADLERRLNEALAEVYGPWAGAWGVRVGRHPSGKATIRQVSSVGNAPDPAGLAAMSVWDGLRLRPEDTRELQRELLAVLERFRQRPAGQTYLIRIAVAPIED